MAAELSLKAGVELGVVPTHIKFVGGLVPDDNGRLPRNTDGQLSVIAELTHLQSISSAPIQSAQVPAFPGVDDGDVEELVSGIRKLGMVVHFIMMVGGADPMNPADEDAVVEMLKTNLETAKKHNVQRVASTSAEEWMQEGAKSKTGAEFEAAVAQVAKVHVRAYQEAAVAGSCIKSWDLEFLRGGEFQTFTSLAKIWELVKTANKQIGAPYFKVMVDAAHCGDSVLTIEENQALIAQIAATDEMGMFHCSAKTTRGCLTTDDGWIGALLTSAAKTGKLKNVFVEIFHHEDPALEGLRNLDPGHGLDTTDGRTYSETVVEGMVDITHRLNNLALRGHLSKA